MDRKSHSPNHPGTPRTPQPHAALGLRPAHQRKHALRCRLVSKTSLIYSDAIGAVRLELWVGDINQHSPPHREPQYIPTPRVIRMVQTLCFAT
jgi:hypothetical protein